MTERLKHLLHAETDHLPVPPPAAGEVLASGHRLVRRKRIGLAVGAVGVAGVMVAAVAIGSSLQAPGPDGRQVTHRIDPATAAYLADGAWARGSTIHVGDATATIQGKVKALYYTSVGVVVRSGNSPWTDSSGPSEYGVIGPDGKVRSLGLDLGDRVPATDPSQPYLAYAEAAGSAWVVKVVDVRTGQQVSRTAVDGAFTWGGWEAPPVALDGDTVYVGTDGRTQAVNWRTGALLPDRPWLGESRMPEVAGGHVVVSKQKVEDYAHPEMDLGVLDAATGDQLVARHLTAWGYLALSPDGRYAKLAIEDDPTGDLPAGFDVYDVATGQKQHFGGNPWDYGWTPDGNLLRVDADSQAVCSPTTGTCDSRPVEPGKGELKIAGNSYES